MSQQQHGPPLMLMLCVIKLDHHGSCAGLIIFDAATPLRGLRPARGTYVRDTYASHRARTVGPSLASVGAVFRHMAPPPHTDTSLSAAATRSPISDVDPPILPASIDAIVGATYRHARAV